MEFGAQLLFQCSQKRIEQHIEPAVEEKKEG
jgi:hypothetical protein